MYVVTIYCYDVKFITCVTMSIHQALLECAWWKYKKHRVSLKKVSE